MENKISKQAECHWCTEEIFSESVYNIKCFWNRTLEGRPICDKCLGSFKYGKQTTNAEDRIKLGLKSEVPTVQENRGLDKWLRK
jgi:hypothetical protein